MAFGDFFRKKHDDDFSDFAKPHEKTQSADFGLPPDGDITNTMPSAFGEEVSSGDSFSPTFSKLQGITRPEPRFPTQDSSHNQSLDKDLRLINAKLDSIKSSLDSMSQRVANLERIAEGKDAVRW